MLNSKQEIFNKIMSHIDTQGKLSKNISGGCYYRTKDGLSCAIGCLIDDETAKEFDSFAYGREKDSSIDYIMGQENKMVPDYFYAHHDFLIRMQHFHDKADDVADWKKSMIEHAKKYKMDIPSV